MIPELQQRNVKQADPGKACELQDKQAGGILQVIQSIVDFEAADCVKAMDNLGCLKKGADSELCAVRFFLM